MFRALPDLVAMKLEIRWDPSEMVPCDLLQSRAQRLDHLLVDDRRHQREVGLPTAACSNRTGLIDIDEARHRDKGGTPNDTPLRGSRPVIVGLSARCPATPTESGLRLGDPTVRRDPACVTAKPAVVRAAAADWLRGQEPARRLCLSERPPISDL